MLWNETEIKVSKCSLRGTEWCGPQHRVTALSWLSILLSQATKPSYQKPETHYGPVMGLRARQKETMRRRLGWHDDKSQLFILKKGFLFSLSYLRLWTNHLPFAALQLCWSGLGGLWLSPWFPVRWLMGLSARFTASWSLGPLPCKMGYQGPTACPAWVCGGPNEQVDK